MVMKRVDEGKSLARRKGQGGPQKLTAAQEWQVKIMMNNKTGLSLQNEGPYATIRLLAYYHILVRFFGLNLFYMFTLYNIFCIHEIILV